MRAAVLDRLHISKWSHVLELWSEDLLLPLRIWLPSYLKRKSPDRFKGGTKTYQVDPSKLDSGYILKLLGWAKTSLLGSLFIQTSNSTETKNFLRLKQSSVYFLLPFLLASALSVAGIGNRSAEKPGRRRLPWSFQPDRNQEAPGVLWDCCETYRLISILNNFKWIWSMF